MPLLATDRRSDGCARFPGGRTLWSLALCFAALLAGCATPGRAPVEDRSSAGSARPDTYTVRKNDTLYSIAWRHNLEYRALAQANDIHPPYTVYPGQSIRLLAALPSTAAAPVTATAAAPAAAKPSTSPARPASPAAQPPARPSTQSADAGSQRPSLASTQSAAKPPAVPPKPRTPATPAAAKPTPSAATKPPAPRPAAPQKPAPAKPRPPTPQAAGQWQRPVSAQPVRGFGGGSNGLDYALAPKTRVRAATPGVVVYAGPGLGGFRHLVIVKASERYLVAYGVNAAPALQEGDTVSSGATVAQVDGDTAARRFHFEVRDRGKPVDPAKLIGSG